MITMQEASEKLLEMFKNTNSPHVAQNRMETGFGMVIQEGFEPPTHGLEERGGGFLTKIRAWEENIKTQYPCRFAVFATGRRIFKFSAFFL